MALEMMDVNGLEIFLFWKVKSCFKYTSFGFGYFFCDLNFNLRVFLHNAVCFFSSKSVWHALNLPTTTWAGSFPVACTRAVSCSLAATVCSRTYRLKNGRAG